MHCLRLILYILMLSDEHFVSCTSVDLVEFLERHIIPGLKFRRIHCKSDNHRSFTAVRREGRMSCDVSASGSRRFSRSLIHKCAGNIILFPGYEIAVCDRIFDRHCPGIVELLVSVLLIRRTGAHRREMDCLFLVMDVLMAQNDHIVPADRLEQNNVLSLQFGSIKRECELQRSVPRFRRKYSCIVLDLYHRPLCSFPEPCLCERGRNSSCT